MTRSIEFTKGQGTGNDFVLIADPNGELELSAEDVRRLCDRRFGIGGDGLIRAVPSAKLPEGASILAEEPAAEWFMDYVNADGSVSEMCGNGVRVFARFLIEHGLVSVAPGETLCVGTRAGVKVLTQSATGFQVDLGRWRLESAAHTVHAAGISVARPSQGISTGNPHLVVALASLDELAAIDLSAPPSIEPELPEGANVEFVVPGDPLVVDGVGQIRMRVHERGSGETLSCGTGAVAAALATRHWAGAGAPNHWRVELPGGVLGVRMFPTEEGEHVSLSGPAELAFRGTLMLG